MWRADTSGIVDLAQTKALWSEALAEMQECRFLLNIWWLAPELQFRSQKPKKVKAE